jgi:fructose 5-dehydrogenase cytochrome subunit
MFAGFFTGAGGWLRALMGLAAGLIALANHAWAQQSGPDTARIEQGRYLAIAADCGGCHTRPNGGASFAGGYAIASPLGPIYSTNITPSNGFGIGTYTEQQFARALRDGIRGDGTQLYPAMPYTSYARLTDADVRALYAYFMHGVTPVDEPVPATALPFPFDIRLSMAVWNLLFLTQQRFVADATKTAQWNRGAYLTEALEHCGSCHTPRNVLMAEDSGRAFAGGPVGSWYAPNITSDPISGVGGWSDADLVQYFRMGAVHGKGQAAGGMAEAVENSLRFLTQDDLAAVAAYIKSTAPIRDPAETRPRYDHGGPVDLEPGLRGNARQTSSGPIQGGEALFSGYCASCHQPTGGGSPNQSYPSLFHNTATGAPNAANLAAAMLFGVDRAEGDGRILMPGFATGSFVQSLSDEKIATIGEYVLRNFGNPNARMTGADVAAIRAGGPVSWLVQGANYAMAFVVIVVAAIVVLGFAWLIRRRKRTFA